MILRARFRVPALAVTVAVVLLMAVPAHAAGKTVHITKSDSAGNAVAGATFTLYVDAAPVGGGPPKGAEDTVVQGTCTTGANGQCDITDVPPGNYWVSETGPPAGYAAAPDSTLEVKKGKRKVFEVVIVNDKKPTNVSVNDPTGDDQVGDGTHIFQFGPAVAVSDNGKQVGIAFNDSPGLVFGDFSGVGFAFSDNGGKTFEDLGRVPPNSGQTFILAQPSTVFDPATGNFLVASQGAVFADDVFRNPILVSIYDPSTSIFGDPVNTFPGITPDPFSAHDPGLAVDPATGSLFLTFTLSNGSGQAEGFLTRSLNGGKTWKPPISVTGPGTNDFLHPTVAPDGNVYVAWTNFGGSLDTTNDYLFARSTDGGLTFSHPLTIANNVLKSGAPALCGGTSRNTYLGSLVTADAPRLAVDPFDSDRIFVVYPGQGAADSSDVFFSSSNDAGKTWSTPTALPATRQTQMFPDIEVTPDGRMAVTFYDATSPTEVDYAAVFATVFFGGAEPLPVEVAFPIEDAVFPTWNTAGPYDTNYNACFGMQGNQIAAPGSGFFMAWADGGDPGPAANGGVDPNIDFAHFDGAFLVTTTSVSVKKGSSTITVNGTVEPQPIPGARVTLKLSIDDGHGFELVGISKPTTGGGGSFSTAFSLPFGGMCKVVARFGGSEGRLASSVTKTFDC